MADVDGDGRLDVVTGSDDCCDGGPGFYWFRREADGRFTAMPEIRVLFGEDDDRPFGLLRFRLQMMLADWDGDGHLDVIAKGPRSDHLGQTGILFRTRGPWDPDDEEVMARTPIEAGTPAPEPSTQPVVVDWDRDGRLDLISAEYHYDGSRLLYRIFLYPNEGTRESPRLGEPRLLVALDHPERLVGLSAADWDGDGWPDLLVASNPEKPKGPEGWRTAFWVYPRRSADSRPSRAPGG